MFKITNEQLIQIAAVDAGLDPFAEYCTKGVYEANGFKVKRGESPVLVLELWCPRIKKDQAGELLSTQEEKQSDSLGGMFFQFKLCHLFTRDQVQDAEEVALEKEARKLRKQEEKAFKKAVMAQGGIKPDQDYQIPRWAKRKDGIALDVAVDEVAAQGFPVQDANGLFDMLEAI